MLLFYSFASVSSEKATKSLFIGHALVDLMLEVDDQFPLHSCGINMESRGLCASSDSDCPENVRQIYSYIDCHPETVKTLAGGVAGDSARIASRLFKDLDLLPF
jgi:sugar/nucleoside kinase (ribokinase family)